MKKLTNEEFIQKLIDVHGNKYDYQLVDYINSRTKIIILCPKHGQFEKIAGQLVHNKQGCSECAKEKISTEEIIKRATEIHGDKYYYSLVNYKNLKTKIKIICPIHGIFEQTPECHVIKKSGCPKCYGNKKLTTEEFIKQAEKIHGDKYNYSLSICLSNKKRLKIICPIHGIFEQTPQSHLKNKCGCQRCSGKAITTEDFIETANRVHKNKYNYSLSHYTNAKSKITIICPTHGIFKQNHECHIIKKSGCPKCSPVAIKTTKWFIEKANYIHENKYDYSLVNYEGIKNKVKIICPTHGVFEQLPSSHLYKKCGCLKCKHSNGEKEIEKFLINNKIKFIPQHSFPSCKYKRKLPFDFYLPELNTCIEYDGIQHFMPIREFGGKESFKIQKIKDKIKTNYCKINKINLIRIKYNKNSTNVLKKFLNI